MSVQVSYPGVYIDEFTPAAPIQGVGTSTAAFIGLCKYGPPNVPTLLTSWDAYLKTFFWPGDTPEDTDYLWYAVRGYFNNGGKVCFVTALSNSQPDFFDLVDITVAKTITVKTRLSGQASPPITVNAVLVNTVSGAQLYQPTANIGAASKDDLSVDVGNTVDALKFRAGDLVFITDATNNAINEEAVVAYVSGTKIFLSNKLQHGYVANSPICLAPLKTFADTFRVEGASGLVVGSIITLSQDPGGGAPIRTQTTIVTGVAPELISSILTTYRVTARDGLSGFTLYGANVIKLQSEEFTLTVKQGAQPSIPYPELSMNPRHPRYYATVVNNDPNGLVLAEPYVGTAGPNITTLPDNRPKDAQTVTLGGGVNHDPTKILLNDYQNALDLLDGINDVNMIAVPGCEIVGVQGEVNDHCFNMHDRFAILDSNNDATMGSIQTQRNGLESPKGFAALYYPWIEIISEKTSKRILQPPSGHVAGIYARTDLNRGVHKAPAGTEAVINGALGVEKLLTDTDQGIINLKGINVIRVFQSGGRPVVWGGRTTSSDTNWQYVNIRRLFIFLEESIQQGIRGAVFEPNNLALWEKLKRTIRAFLMTQWRDGALFGKTAEEAFYIRIDDVLNPFSEQALGRLNIEIGVRPSYPAEFIVVRIGIWQGGSDVSEA